MANSRGMSKITGQGAVNVMPNQRFQPTAPLRGASLATLGAAEPGR